MTDNPLTEIQLNPFMHLATIH